MAKPPYSVNFVDWSGTGGAGYLLDLPRDGKRWVIRDVQVSYAGDFPGVSSLFSVSMNAIKLIQVPNVWLQHAEIPLEFTDYDWYETGPWHREMRLVIPDPPYPVTISIDAESAPGDWSVYVSGYALNLPA